MKICARRCNENAGNDPLAALQTLHFAYDGVFPTERTVETDLFCSSDDDLFASGAQGQTVQPPTMGSGNHELLCQNEWTKRGVLDRSMYRYCLRKQAEGYKDFVALLNRYSGETWLQGVVDNAVSEWSKRDARDDAMVAYEVKKQIEAYLDSVYISKQAAFNKNAFAQCEEDWTKRAPDWSMIMYCYKQKTE